MLLELDAPAPDVSFPSEDGAEQRLSDFWRAGPTVFVFLRHFG